MSSPRDRGAADGASKPDQAGGVTKSKEPPSPAAVAQTLPGEALMATLLPADAPASARSLRSREAGPNVARQADGQFAVTLGPDGPIDPHAATLRPSDQVDPYAQTLSPSRKSAALADTMAPEDGATGSTLGPESAASLREHSLDGVVSVGDMSRLHSDYPVARWDRYEFQKKLGQGGMGAVYKARDRRLGRDVALKFIRGGDPNMVMRFLQEARAQARIDHPHVCKVYEVGEVEGKAYIAMQYVDGHSLNRAAKDLSLTEKVLLMRQVAEAMHEAHRLGIIHRDLKPDNIMVERLTDGTLSPVVMDFGLARESGDNRGLTESGAVMGTPAYMAPEQARGDVRTLDRRADVYSLGATLYDLVAGSPPFDAESIVDVLMQVMNEDAVPLRNRLPSVPSDLETIVMKCLRKEPGARYDSAKALADDLQRYIDGEPIQGRRESVIGRVRRRAKKNLALVFVSAGSLVLVVSFAVQWIRVQLAASRERARAAELVKLERQLGQDIKEMEWFLRSAYQLPLHDITPQLAIVRTRMAAMETQRAALRGDDGGRIDYAIGRGHLALHEPTEALRYLKAAKQRGLDIPELHYALGRALGERFQQALEEARRQGDKSWVEKRRKELEAEYLQPAVQELEKSRGGSLDSPEYLQGLIAFYQKQYDSAVDNAKLAAQKAPWLYESLQLQGMVMMSRGIEAREKGNYDQALSDFDLATTNFSSASDIGRSDYINYNLQAESFHLKSDVLIVQGKPRTVELQNLLSLSEKAINANKLSATGYVKAAYANFWIGFGELLNGSSPEPSFKKASELAILATGINPADAYAYDVLGNSLSFYGSYEKDKHRDPLPLWLRAETAFRKAIALNPRFPWAHNDLGLLLQARGGYYAQQDSRRLDDLMAATESFRRAVETDDEYIQAYVNLLETYASLTTFQALSGIDSYEILCKAEQLYEKVIKVNPEVPYAYFQIALAYSGRLLDTRLSKKEFEQIIAKAEAAIKKMSSIMPGHHFADLLTVALLQARAERMLAEGSDPTSVLEEGSRVGRGCIERNPKVGLCYARLAKVEYLMAKWLEYSKKNNTKILAAALERAKRGSVISPEESECAQVLTEVMIYYAMINKSPPAVWNNALVAAQMALKQKSGDAHNHARLALVLRALAQSNGTSESDAGLLRESEASLRQAILQNPTLEDRYRRELAALTAGRTR